MRRDYKIISSATYHINPKHLRELRLELTKRTRDNAYTSHGEYKHLTAEQRGGIYDQLKAKIQAEGFKDEFPITVMLLRKDDRRDKILQGHHRLNMAIELGLPTVPVRFVY